MSSPLEIHCDACGKKVLLRREPVYEGFKKTGERRFCASCGHEFAEEDELSSPGSSARPSVFTEADKSRVVDIFSEDEKEKNCRRCAHYVVNPFTQRCGLHGKVVEATDVCFDFEPPPDDAEEDEENPPVT